MNLAKLLEQQHASAAYRLGYQGYPNRYPPGSVESKWHAEGFLDALQDANAAKKAYPRARLTLMASMEDHHEQARLTH